MTSITHGRSRRIATHRLRSTLSSMLSLMFVLAGCATTAGGPSSAGLGSGGTSDAASVAASEAAANATASSASIAAVAPDGAASSPEADPSDASPAPVPVPVDPLQPDIPVNLDDRAVHADLWARVRQGFAIADIDNDLVRANEQWYAARPDYVQRMTERGSRYLFHIVEELQRRGMPTELALLPFIESAYNPQAMSTAKASGMWQFVPATGRDFALKQNVFRDDRRDVLASTRAALDYMQRLYSQFGDWHLALAAYNWGEGSVARAIARNQKAGLPTDYASLKMPNETQSYVPKLQAVKNIILHPGDFGLSLPEVANHPYFLSVPIERDMDVALAARLAGMTLDAFQAMNPQMNKPVILAAGTPQILLPFDNAERFTRTLPLQRGPLASWTAWVLPKTMRPAAAAKQVGMSEAELREVNKIPQRMLVKAGSTLLVPRSGRRLDDVPMHVADNAVMALSPDLPPLRKVSLRAGRKESVATVAKRYGVSAAQVAQWNRVAPAASFAPGQNVVVFVAARATRGKATHTATSAHASGHKHGPKVMRTAAARPVRLARN